MDFQIKISAVAELRALKELEASLVKQVAQARALGTTATQSYRDMEQQLAKVQAKIGEKGLLSNAKSEILGMAEQIPGVGAAMRSLNGAVGPLSTAFVGISIGAAAGAAALREYAAAEERMASLDAALAQRGQLTKEYRIQLQDLAAQMQETTAIADDNWLPVLEQLTKAGATPDTIEKYTLAVTNLAGAINVDIGTASQMFTKAMMGNTQALTRYGFTIQEGASKTQALDAIMQQAANRGAGMLEARAQSLNGTMRQVRNTWSDVQEALGRFIAKTGVAQLVLQGLADAFNFWAQKLGGSIEPVGDLTNKLGELQGATAKSEQSARGFTDAQTAMARASQGTNERLKEQATALANLRRRQDELADEEMALALAQVDAGGGTETEKAQARVSIRKQFADQKFQRQQQEDQARMEATRAAMGSDAATVTQSSRNVMHQQQRVAQAGQMDAEERAARQALINQAKTALSLEQQLESQMPDDKHWRTGRPMKNRQFLTESELQSIEQLQASLAAARKAQEEAQARVDTITSRRDQVGLGTQAQEQETLNKLSEEHKKLAEAVAVEQQARAKVLRDLAEEIQFRQRLQQLRNATAETVGSMEVDKAVQNERRAADEQASRQAQEQQAAAEKARRDAEQAAQRAAADLDLPNNLALAKRRPGESNDQFSTRRRENELDNTALRELPGVLKSFADGIDPAELAEATALIEELGPRLGSELSALKSALAQLNSQIKTNPK